MFTVLVVKGGTSNNIWEKAQRDHSVLNDAIWELRIIVSRHCRWTWNVYLLYIARSWNCKFRRRIWISYHRIGLFFIERFHTFLNTIGVSAPSPKLSLPWNRFYFGLFTTGSFLITLNSSLFASSSGGDNWDKLNVVNQLQQSWLWKAFQSFAWCKLN